MTHWMFHCNEVSQKVSQAMDTKLPVRHRMAIRVHLMMCRYCARFHRQLLLLRKMCQLEGHSTSETSIPNALTPDARERIKVSLRSLP